MMFLLSILMITHIQRIQKIFTVLLKDPREQSLEYFYKLVTIRRTITITL